MKRLTLIISDRAVADLFDIWTYIAEDSTVAADRLVDQIRESCQHDFGTELRAFEEEQNMRYITSIERMGLEKGRKEGRKEGLLEAVRLALELRFGAAGLALMPEVQALEDAVLLRIQEALIRGLSREEVRQICTAARPADG